MTQQQAAAHERYLKGINLKMLWGGGFFLVTVVSSFWIGLNELKNLIKDNNTQSNERITAVANAIKRSQDSIQHINELQFKDVWNAIENRAAKVIYRSPQPQGFVTEYRDPKTGETIIKKH